MKDNEYYQKHRQQLKETDRVLDTLATEHLVPISNAKTIQIEEDRATEVERQNKHLFNKIENIMYRQGPYKKQSSRHNSNKPAKIFYVPSDNTVTQSTYIPQQTFSMTKVKRD